MIHQSFWRFFCNSCTMKSHIFKNLVLVGCFLSFGTFTNVQAQDASPEEGDYFEGDMILTEQQQQEIETAAEQRALMKFTTRHWPNGVLVYRLDAAFSSVMLIKISQAMEHWTVKTCVTFREKTNADTNYVQFTAVTRGCSSYVGRIPGGQSLNLEPRCSRGNIIHEIGHALGFFHEQSRPDRNLFVTINWGNIITTPTDYTGNFVKYSYNVIDSLGEPYDYGSIMHYGRTFFGINGAETITPHDQNVFIGQRYGLSQSDIRQANLLYCDKPAVCEDNWTTCAQIDAQKTCWGYESFNENTFIDVATNCKRTCGLCCSCKKDCPVPFMMDTSCWKDTINQGFPRIFSNILINKRKDKKINWGSWSSWLPEFVCECAKETQAKGWKYFAIMFYGECWSGPGNPDYQRDGSTDNCSDQKYNNCNPSDQALDDQCCAGQCGAFKLYKIIQNHDVVKLCG